MSNELPRQKHHFVPEWYQRQFTDTDAIWIHDFVTHRTFEHNPKKLLREHRLYYQDWAGEEDDPNAIENFLADEIEPRGKNSILRLLSMPSDFTADEAIFLAAFIEMQRFRVPRQMESGNALAGPFVSPLEKQRARIDQLELTIGTWIRWFGFMRFDIFEADNTAFITSDSPVSIFNQCVPVIEEPRIELAGAQIHFPLSSKYMLQISHPSFVYGKSDPLRILPDPPKTDSEIPVTLHPPISDETVMKYNYGTLRKSHRFILGRSKEILLDTVRIAES